MGEGSEGVGKRPAQPPPAPLLPPLHLTPNPKVRNKLQNTIRAAREEVEGLEKKYAILRQGGMKDADPLIFMNTEEKANVEASIKKLKRRIRMMQRALQEHREEWALRGAPTALVEAASLLSENDNPEKGKAALAKVGARARARA